MRKEDRLALSPLPAVLLIVALGLGIVVLLISLGVTQFLVPSPEGEAEQFVRSLAGHNYEAARDRLSEDLRGQVKAEDLRAAVKAIEEKAGGIEQASGEKAMESGDSATGTVKVTLGDRSEEELVFPLEQEHGLWRLASIEPLLALAGE